MLTRRKIAAIVTALLLSTIAAAPVSAAKPTRPTDPPGERALTADERAASDRRIAAAEAYARGIHAEGSDLVSLACVTPESTTSPNADAGTQACGIPQGFLGVEARDQVFGHYCGPAVGQVIANYSWAMAAGVNKYTQGRIAIWMGTDATGQTDAFGMEDGLETATTGAPRRPANWDWVVTDLRDRDGDGTTGDELHTYVRSNISASRMPMAVPVKPHDFASRFNLSSWPNPVASPGHWISIYGWVNTWDGGDRARMYFTDSSRDEGGATGKFWNPTRHIAILIGEHTRRFVW
jgi:hypothetical protein